MKNIFIFVLGVVATIIVIGIVVQINSFLHPSNKIIMIEEVDSTLLPIDTIVFLNKEDEKEFTRETMRVIQGDLTLEQIDSMQKSWIEQGNDFGD
jgi:hypothetical protein